MIDFQRYRFGSAGFANRAMRGRAGLHGKRGAYIGHDEAGRPCHSDQQSAILLCGGARSGKGNFIIPWLVDGCLASGGEAHHVISLDWKGQNGVIAGMQVPQNRRIYNYNPRGNRGVPSHRMNPWSHLRGGAPTLVADALLSSASWIPFTDPRAAYFEGMAQKIVCSASVVLARTRGVVTPPELADKMAGLGAASEEWLAFEFDISQQPEPEINQVARDLRRLRAGKSDSGGWEGIKNEVAKSFVALMDPQVRAALSPPYDFDFEWLTRGDFPPAMVNVMEDIEFADTSGPIIRALFTSALIYKRRAITARPQFWCLDEISACGAWPLAPKLATICAGYNIRTAYVCQSLKQLDALAPNAGEIIANSCGTAIYIGTRSPRQASLISGQLGKITLDYDDTARQEAARAAKARAVADALTGGADPVTAMMNAAHQDRMARHKSKMARPLRTPDEVMNAMNRAFVFMPGALERPFYAKVPKYWRRRDLAGRYLGDPFHARPGHVEIATWLGQRQRAVIIEEVPPDLRDWPQYRDGQWSYVRGFRP